ncbi:sulfotransferase 1B1-like isoform X2 [Ptychodera flava]|uniref:sulfotransferase 1B1-like isoform X2 n=1 Tax=Ptychodera flava TaxID=63121 RepID=UPI00396A4F35
MSDIDVKPPWEKSYYLRPGYLLPTLMNKDTIETHVRDFAVRDDDVFLISYARSGTAWTNTILNAIIYVDNLTYLDSIDIHTKLACLEVGPTGDDLAAEGMVFPKSFIEMFINDCPSPRVIHSHLYVDFLPKQYFVKKPKTVYIRRDPKDVLVSIAEHHNSAKYHGCVPWEKYFEEFLKENGDYGSPFTHTKKCAEFMNEPRWLCFTYEELRKDIRSAIKKMSDFIGKTLNEEEIDKVINYTSFNQMKERYENSPTPFYQEKNAGKWIRKGVVGDWKHHFTVTQNETFDRVYAEKMKGYEHLMYKY